MEKTFGQEGSNSKEFYTAWKKQRLVPENDSEIAGDSPDDRAQRFPSCTKEQTNSALKIGEKNVDPSRAFFPRDTKPENKDKEYRYLFRLCSVRRGCFHSTNNGIKNWSDDDIKFLFVIFDSHFEHRFIVLPPRRTSSSSSF